MKYLRWGALLFLIACTSQNINKNADTVDQASVVSLTRVFQRVVRYDCNGAVSSDQIETVQSPVDTITINPKTSDKLYSSTFDNLTLNTSPNCIVGYNEFNVDYSEGWCNMRVASGNNQIRYRFYYCDQIVTKYDSQGNPYTVCATDPILGEEGTTWINVSYSESTLPDTLSVHPDPDTCKTQ